VTTGVGASVWRIAGPARGVMIDDPTDDDLLAATSRGEERAFRRLVERHAARARGLALRLTRNDADADDLVQEAFTRTFERAGRWRSEGVKFSTWLYRVIVNLAADEGRKRAVRRAVPIEDAPEPISPVSGADERVERDARARALRRAIDGLPERQREAIALTYGTGLANAEVASVLGITVEAVEAALTRARAALKADMRRTGWIEERAS
jgi:RNA polymerase sigma-70 factor (ECF subfamily)